ncbi:MAG: phosphodiesterase [Deltaproteobacteria bacterium]|nr:phosphodiesterase [Deltaproteobacteria bacterium]
MRGRFYAIFALVLLSLESFVGAQLIPRFLEVSPWLYGAALYLHASVYVHLASLLFAKLRPLAWRALVSIPAHFMFGASALAFPWAVGQALGAEPGYLWAPYALALLGVVHSLTSRRSLVDLRLDELDIGERVRRYPLGEASAERPLRLVQITDPHLGPWMSVARLKRIAQRAVEHEPDLILLTGDFLTMESNGDPDALAEALSPLGAMPGRVFACRGNHDLEAPRTVAEGLRRAGVRLLVDEAEVVDTPAGCVQVLGLDFNWREREARMREACAAHPRVDGALRLVMLHDPGAFKLLPEAEADLVLSGHTHGGQVGVAHRLLALTPLWPLFRLPDHGFFARGRARMYVHRGSGHYGFPLRIGVTSEESLLRVHLAAAPSLGG